MDTPNHRRGLLVGAEALHQRFGYLTLGVSERREYWRDREDTDHFVTLAAESVAAIHATSTYPFPPESGGLA